MSHRPLASLIGTFLILSGVASGQTLHSFARSQLTDVYFSEGVGIGDLNGDGTADVVYGPHWYAGPDFKAQHEIYPPVPQNRDGYADHFFAWVHDFNADGRGDVFVVGFPGTPAHVYENPGADGFDQHWTKHQVFNWVSNESPHFVDLVGDGDPELVCTRGGSFGYTTIDPQAPFGEWVFHKISPRMASERFGHGLGVGDIDGDGRKDVIHKDGWFQQPESLEGDPMWQRHEYRFTARGGAEMLVYDVDGDGDNDVITSLAAHEYGLAWFEQSRAGDEIDFTQHLIMGGKPAENRYGVVFSELHTLGLADMDGDGLKDIVTGKTYWSHHRQSPGWDDGAVVYWFRLVRGDDGVDWVPYQADGEAGVGRQVVVGDLNGDGLPDIATGGMQGAHVMIQSRRVVSDKEWKTAQPKIYEGPKDRGLIAGFPPEGWPSGIEPVDQDGQSLNLGFESGTLQGWTAVGKAFDGQPVLGDTVKPRRKESSSRHIGNYWIGSYEQVGDTPKGSLISSAFKVTHPYASFLVGGGKSEKTRVEMIDVAMGKPFLKIMGDNREDLRPVILDLRHKKGRLLRIRIVDEESSAWGHINFDDFRFHGRRPRFPGKQHPIEEPPLDAFEHAGLDPEAAAAAMTVPDGFSVTLSASEPDVKQPIAMAIDHRGRLWVAESYSYPVRVAADKARDRVLVFEDVDGDGKFDSRKVFAEKLNLISGLEVGFGGVWVGAAPHFMFIPDRDGDDVPDSEPVVLLDGWGYQDTHETLNAFIWGPDGWLYGCHGVFTHSRVGKPGTPEDQRVKLNAAVWRYHPTRHEFEVFMHGASNQWGIDWNDHGQAFITACVIPHLYHVVQGGRYQRQAGNHFNANTYDDIKTIADHMHWGGTTPFSGTGRSSSSGGGHAHVGAMIYLGGTWPDKFRGLMFMNNIHGARINVDSLTPKGSSFNGGHWGDFLFANDVWSQIVSLRYGPDGNVWMIDWYDENQCHRRDPTVHDRSNGRIFKLSYGENRNLSVDLNKLDDSKLVSYQTHSNDWFVRHSRRLLQERAAAGELEEGTRVALEDILRTSPATPIMLRALWALHVTGGVPLPVAARMLRSKSDYVRAWSIQLLCEQSVPDDRVLDRFETMAAEDGSPVVRLYLACALQRLPLDRRWEIAERLARHAEDATDHNIPFVLWYGIEPLVSADLARAMRLAQVTKIPLLARFITRRAASMANGLDAVVSSIGQVEDAAMQRSMLTEVVTALRGRARPSMPASWSKIYGKLASSEDKLVRERAEFLAVRFGDRRVFPVMRETLIDSETSLADRRHALTVLAEGGDPDLPSILHDLMTTPGLRLTAISALGGYADADTPKVLIDHYGNFDPAQQRAAISVMSSRAPYARSLLDAVAEGRMPRVVLTAFVIRQMRRFKDAGIDARIAEVWGAVRSTSASKVAEIVRYKKLLTSDFLAAADLRNGRVIYSSTCFVCHKLFGTGGAIGPEITGSNRADLDYILENLIDPNALVGKDHQMSVVEMKDGRAITGRISAQNESALTIQTQTEQIVVDRSEVAALQTLPISLMPEGQLQSLTDKDARDLIAYLASPAQVPEPGEKPRLDPATHRVWGAIEGEALKRDDPTG
ncbi:MAG: FG-GAP-like repeat-containing protein, partial [Planctomycetota bacterium]|nr:FG-GAP-like repeat-containing protein [Planctomycetota bacterium]